MSVLCMYAEGVCCRMNFVETCTHCVLCVSVISSYLLRLLLSMGNCLTIV